MLNGHAAAIAHGPKTPLALSAERQYSKKLARLRHRSSHPGPILPIAFKLTSCNSSSAPSQAG